MQNCKPAVESKEGPVPTTPVAQASSQEAAPKCDRTTWQHFASVESAFASVLSTKPRVVAIGETHARRDAPDVLTATERFASNLLPIAKGQGANVLVVELLSPPGGCETETKAVAAVQKPVVAQQDDQNQDRFIALGHRARALQMTPLVLEPTCDEFAVVRKAGADGVAAMLELIATHTRAKLERLVGKVAEDELIVAYGGALHNNLGADAPFAFGEHVKRVTNGRYVALDLIVPEYVADTEAWRKLPWYGCWPELASKGVTLVQSAPGEFTLFMDAALKRSAGMPGETAGPSASAASGATGNVAK